MCIYVICHSVYANIYISGCDIYTYKYGIVWYVLYISLHMMGVDRYVYVYFPAIWWYNWCMVDGCRCLEAYSRWTPWYVCMDVWINLGMSVCRYVGMYACMYGCMYSIVFMYSCMHVFTYVRVYNIWMYVSYCIEVGMQLHKKLELQEAHHTASPSLSLGNHPNRSCFGLVNLHDSANWRQHSTHLEV